MSDENKPSEDAPIHPKQLRKTRHVESVPERRAQYIENVHNEDISDENAFNELSLKALREHYDQKRNWSWLLIIIIAVMTAFQMFLLWFVGVGVWDFTDYDWLLPALLAQNFGQIVLLANVAVTSLFETDGLFKRSKNKSQRS